MLLKTEKKIILRCVHIINKRNKFAHGGSG